MVFILKLNFIMAALSTNDAYFGPYKLDRSSLFYESEYCYGLVNLKPIVQGHVLIIPKRVVARCGDMTKEEITDLMLSVHKVAPILEKEYACSAMNIAMQDGPDAGQSVPHVHFHILPRKSGDYERNDDVYEELEKQELNNVFDENKPRVARTKGEMAQEALTLRDNFPDNHPKEQE